MMQEEMYRPTEPFDRSMLRPLRPRQSAAIEAIRQAIAEGHRRIVVQAPTGFGKTLTAAHIIGGSLEKGRRALFTCPAIALVNQTLSAFEREGILDIGVMQAQHERTDFFAHCQIASVQTLIRRRRIPDFDVALIDECHNQFDKLNALLLSAEWKDKIVIGLSATPWARGMGLIWTKLIVAATVQELIDEGWLCPFRAFASAEDADLSKVRITAGDFNEADLADAMNKPKLVGDVVQHWLKKGEGRSTFLFAVNRAHAQALQDEFQKAGVPCGYIDGFSTPEERADLFRRFRDGDDRIISSVGCLTTGVDEDVRCIIDAQPTKSEMRHVQKIGRGLRLAEGKDHLIILDHGGNNARLGFVTDIFHGRLNSARPGEREKPDPAEKETPKPRKCKSCGCLIPAGQKQCSSCGERFVPAHDVIVEDGELVEMRVGAKHSTRPKPAPNCQAFYSGAIWIQRERGYKSGWAANFYREKFGTWPPRELHADPIPPNQEVLGWKRHRDIAYAKSRRA